MSTSGKFKLDEIILAYDAGALTTLEFINLQRGLINLPFVKEDNELVKRAEAVREAKTKRIEK
jgi:hypothetical protein